ncbi:MAG: MoxR family ATPase [Clostridiales bacterium]
MIENNIDAQIEFVNTKAKELIYEVEKVVVGQISFIEKLVIILFTGGHALIEGVPGVAKTLTAKTLAKAIDTDFKRIQFTPDLMPADIIGTKIYDVKSGEFYLKKGAVFTNIFLADEINRTPPKTQAALLEVMEEQSVSIDGETNILDNPFMVLATQNPVEYEGTYQLPEAQLDRFIMKLIVGYIPQNIENNLLSNFVSGNHSLKDQSNKTKAVLTPNDITICREYIKNVRVDNSIINYITNIINLTRNSPSLMLGGSPRASISLLSTARTYAAIQGRSFVIPEDVKELAIPILRHRIILKPEVMIDGISTDNVITRIVNKVEVPR